MSANLKEQREQQGVIVPASKTTALTNNASPVSAYLAAHGVGMNGTFFKFAKDGKFRKTSDDEEIPEGTQFVVIYEQIQGGWIKFMGKGNPPERKQGNLFEGFVPPDRESLGDLDQSEWEEGLSGKPADPWQFQILLPLQNVETGELFVFNTSSITGRRAVDGLVAACARMQRTEPNDYPVVKLRVGGFQHRDERIGWIKTPSFDRVGKVPKADTAAASVTPTDQQGAAPFDDEITL
jgi:hypothetical protein